MASDDVFKINENNKNNVWARQFLTNTYTYEMPDKEISGSKTVEEECCKKNLLSESIDLFGSCPYIDDVCLVKCSCNKLFHVQIFQSHLKNINHEQSAIQPVVDEKSSKRTSRQGRGRGQSKKQNAVAKLNNAYSPNMCSTLVNSSHHYQANGPQCNISQSSSFLNGYPGTNCEEVLDLSQNGSAKFNELSKEKPQAKQRNYRKGQQRGRTKNKNSHISRNCPLDVPDEFPLETLKSMCPVDVPVKFPPETLKSVCHVDVPDEFPPETLKSICPVEVPDDFPPETHESMCPVDVPDDFPPETLKNYVPLKGGGGEIPSDWIECYGEGRADGHSTEVENHDMNCSFDCSPQADSAYGSEKSGSVEAPNTDSPPMCESSISRPEQKSETHISQDIYHHEFQDSGISEIQDHLENKEKTFSINSPKRKNDSPTNMDGRRKRSKCESSNLQTEEIKNSDISDCDDNNLPTKITVSVSCNQLSVESSDNLNQCSEGDAKVSSSLCDQPEEENLQKLCPSDIEEIEELLKLPPCSEDAIPCDQVDTGQYDELFPPRTDSDAEIDENCAPSSPVSLSDEQMEVVSSNSESESSEQSDSSSDTESDGGDDEEEEEDGDEAEVAVEDDEEEEEDGDEAEVDVENDEEEEDGNEAEVDVEDDEEGEDGDEAEVDVEDDDDEEEEDGDEAEVDVEDDDDEEEEEDGDEAEVDVEDDDDEEEEDGDEAEVDVEDDDEEEEDGDEAEVDVDDDDEEDGDEADVDDDYEDDDDNRSRAVSGSFLGDEEESSRSSSCSSSDEDSKMFKKFLDEEPTRSFTPFSLQPQLFQSTSRALMKPTFSEYGTMFSLMQFKSGAIITTKNDEEDKSTEDEDSSTSRTEEPAASTSHAGVSTGGHSSRNQSHAKLCSNCRKIARSHAEVSTGESSSRKQIHAKLCSNCRKIDGTCNESVSQTQKDNHSSTATDSNSASKDHNPFKLNRTYSAYSDLLDNLDRRMFSKPISRFPVIRETNNQHSFEKVPVKSSPSKNHIINKNCIDSKHVNFSNSPNKSPKKMKVNGDFRKHSCESNV